MYIRLMSPHTDKLGVWEGKVSFLGSPWRFSGWAYPVRMGTAGNKLPRAECNSQFWWKVLFMKEGITRMEMLQEPGCLPGHTNSAIQSQRQLLSQRWKHKTSQACQPPLICLATLNIGNIFTPLYFSLG